MKIHVILADGTSKTVDVVVSELSDEQLEVYAEMGSEEAVEELQNRIGFNPYKPIEEYTRKDAKRYSKFLKSKKKEKKTTDER
jgi:hypothetical protein